MSANPEARQRSASQLLQDLDSACRAGAGEAAAARASARHGDRPGRPQRQPPSAPPPPRGTAQRPRKLRARVLAIGALATGAAAVLVLVVVLSGERAPPPAPSRPHATPTSQPATTAAPAAPRPLSATGTVRAFYRRAAAGQYRAAWRLAGPGMRSAFGNSFERFRGDLSSLRRIKFERVAIKERDGASVTVEIQSVATHEDRVDHCSGTLRTVRGGGGHWVVEPVGIDCTSG